MTSPYAPQPTGPRKLHRSTQTKMLAGVCGGLAEYTGWDVTLIRLVVALGTVVGFGSLALAYLVAWVLLPKQ